MWQHFCDKSTGAVSSAGSNSVTGALGCLHASLSYNVLANLEGGSLECRCSELCEKAICFQCTVRCKDFIKSQAFTIVHETGFAPCWSFLVMAIWFQELQSSICMHCYLYLIECNAILCEDHAILFVSIQYSLGKVFFIYQCCYVLRYFSQSKWP